jgi:uncharacterized integral membrane protein (TIGR00697 family)
MNELLFILQIVLMVGALFWASKLGKEALITLCVLLGVMANLFVLKQMLIAGWNVTCSDAFAIGSIFGLNMIAQTYGRDAAKKTIWISFFGMVFFAALSQVHLLFTPSPADTSHPHFAFLLYVTPRLLVASLATFFLVQQLDVRLYGLFQKKFSNWSWQTRSTVCLLISQAVDTVLFSFLGLYGMFQELTSMIVVSYLVKCAVIGLTSMVAGFYDPLKKLMDKETS